MNRYLHDGSKVLQCIPANGKTVSPLQQFECGASDLSAQLTARGLALYITTGQKQRYLFSQASPALKIKWGPLLPGIAALNAEGKETEAKTVIAALVPTNAEETALRETLLSV